MKNRRFSSFAPVPTPLDSEDRFDAAALRSHLSWLAASGLGGVLVLGTNGEFPSLSLEERLRVAEVAADVGGDLQRLLGVGSCSLTEVEAMLRTASEHHFDAALCPPPFYFRSAPLAGLVRFFLRVLDRADLPVVLYHIPQVTGIPIDDRLLDAIGDHPRLGGVKDSSGDRSELRRLSSRFAGRGYFVGTDHLVRSCLEVGGSGSISAAASVVPGIIASLPSEPNRQDLLSRLRSLLEEYGLGPAVKAILRAKGFGEYQTRPPLVGLSSDRARELLDRFSELAGDDFDIA